VLPFFCLCFCICISSGCVIVYLYIIITITSIQRYEETKLNVRQGRDGGFEVVLLWKWKLMVKLV
jgi:hypothetical protein